MDPMHCTINKAAIPSPVLTDRFKGSEQIVHSQPGGLPLRAKFIMLFLFALIIVEQLTLDNYDLLPGKSNIKAKSPDYLTL